MLVVLISTDVRTTEKFRRVVDSNLYLNISLGASGANNADSSVAIASRPTLSILDMPEKKL